MSARYSAGQSATAAQQVAAVAGQIDGLFIPEQADAMPAARARWLRAMSDEIFGYGCRNDAQV